MFPLYNIVSDIIASVVVCVDFLDTHIASLVLFFKTRCDNDLPLPCVERRRDLHLPRMAWQPNPLSRTLPSLTDSASGAADPASGNADLFSSALPPSFNKSDERSGGSGERRIW